MICGSVDAALLRADQLKIANFQFAIGPERFGPSPRRSGFGRAGGTQMPPVGGASKS
jgi:hypothetical protein